MGQLDSKEIERSVMALETEKSIHHSQSQEFLHDFHANHPKTADVHIFEDDKLKLFLKYFIQKVYQLETSARVSHRSHQESILDKAHQVKLASLKSILQKVEGLTVKMKSDFEVVCQEITKVMIDAKYSSQKSKYFDFIFRLLEVDLLSNFVFDFQTNTVESTRVCRDEEKGQLQTDHSVESIEKLSDMRDRFEEILEGTSAVRLSNEQINAIKEENFKKAVGNVYLARMPVNAKKVSFFMLDLANYFGAYDSACAPAENKKLQRFVEDLSSILNVLFTGMKEKSEAQKPAHVCWIILKIFSIVQTFKYNNCMEEISKSHSSGFHEVNGTASLSDLFDRIYSSKSYDQYSRDVEHVGQKIQAFEACRNEINGSVAEFLQKLYKEKAVGYIANHVKTETSHDATNSFIEKKKFASFHNILISEEGKKQNVTINVIAPKNTRRNHQSLLAHGEVSLNCEEWDIQSPDFNILQVPGEKIEAVVVRIFLEMNFLKSQEQTSMKKLDSFIKKLNKGYSEHSNPFHNFAHGVNVMHTSYLMCLPQKSQAFLSDLSRFALMLSALCHDVGHTGFNNAFQVATNSPLAEQFNDSSPLENYHITRTLQLLKSDSTNFLDFLSHEQFQKVRKLIISNILCTDIKEHFNLLKKFEEKKAVLKSEDFEDEKLFCGMLIHSSDFGGSAKEFAICEQWSQRVNQEFMKQSRMQKELGLTMSPFMVNLDRPAVMAKNELGFLKFMVQPLFKSVSEYFSGDKNLAVMLTSVNSNVEKWQQKLKAQEEKTCEVKNI